MNPLRTSMACAQLVSAVVGIVAMLGCESPAAPPPALEPLWSLNLGPELNFNPGSRAGFGDGGIAVAIPIGLVGNSTLERIEDGEIVWSKELTMGELAVSQNGRVHYLGGMQVYRIEPTGSELSPLGVGPEFPQLVAARNNVATVAKYESTGVGNPKVIQISAANSVSWERTIDGAGRCLYADVLRVSDDLVVVGGTEGGLLGDSTCHRQTTENVWLAALSAIDGRLLWSQVMPPGTTPGASGSVRVRGLNIGTDAIFVVGTFGVTALRLDGTEVWRRGEREPNYFLADIEVLSPDVVVQINGSRLVLIDSADGSELEEVRIEEAQGGRLFFDGIDTLYFAGSRVIDSNTLQPAAGALRWNGLPE